MRKLNICIDIDGTVTEPYYWLERANRYFERHVRPEDVTTYEIHKVLDVEEDDYTEFYELYGKLLHKESKARFGAGEAVRRLYRDHSIHFVTARDESMRDTSIEWLDRHQMPMDSIYLLGTPNKVSTAAELKSDLFIEDSYANAVQLAQAGFDVVLIDCSYNKGPLPEQVIRVKSWSEIMKLAAQKSEVLRTVS